MAAATPTATNRGLLDCAARLGHATLRMEAWPGWWDDGLEGRCRGWSTAQTWFGVSSRATPAREAGRFVRSIRLDPAAPVDGYPFDLPLVTGLRAAGGLDLPPGTTFLVGENGSGKSTLVEAVAVAAGFNPEGGSRSFRFSTRASHSTLGQYLRLVRAPGRERTSYFLRAESFFNVATQIDDLDREDPGLLAQCHLA